MKVFSDMKNSREKQLREKIIRLEKQVKHLSNELQVTRKEYETTANNYFDMYSNMGRKVEYQAELLQTVLDNIPAFVYWKDKKLSYLGCNRNISDIIKLEK